MGKLEDDLKWAFKDEPDAGVARVYFGFGCDHSAPATMMSGEYRP
jgi:hypothetical protein